MRRPIRCVCLMMMAFAFACEPAQPPNLPTVPPQHPAPPPHPAIDHDPSKPWLAHHTDAPDHRT